MKFFHHCGALAAGNRAPVNTAVMELAGTVNFTAECVCFFVALKNSRSSKAGPVRHTSTEFFCRVEIFRLEFFRELLFITLVRRSVKYRAS